MTDNTGLNVARNLINEYDAINERIVTVTSILEFNHTRATKLLRMSGRLIDLHEVDPELGNHMQKVIDNELHEQLRKYKSRLKEIENQLGGVK